MKLTKNDGADKNGYSICGIGFDARSQFLWFDGSWNKNVIILVVDNSCFVHVNNKKNDILVLVEGRKQRLYDITKKAEAKYPINSTESGKRFALNLHSNGSNSFLFVNTVKMNQFKAKHSEINPCPLFLVIFPKNLQLIT